MQQFQEIVETPPAIALQIAHCHAIRAIRRLGKVRWRSAMACCKLTSYRIYIYIYIYCLYIYILAMDTSHWLASKQEHHVSTCLNHAFSITIMDCHRVSSSPSFPMNSAIPLSMISSLFHKCANIKLVHQENPSAGTQSHVCQRFQRFSPTCYDSLESRRPSRWLGNSICSSNWLPISSGIYIEDIGNICWEYVLGIFVGNMGTPNAPFIAPSVHHWIGISHISIGF